MITQVKCKRCKYKWQTKSDHILVSCPSCGIKNKIREIPKEVEGETSSAEKLDESKKEVVENTPQRGNIHSA